MASTNQSPFYQRAEEDFLASTTDEERISCLEIMIKECPKHKGAEKMLSQLRTRLKKLKEKVEKQKSSGKGGGKVGIKKSDMQCALIGFTNAGKSSIFNCLTQLNAKVSPHPYSTLNFQLGTFKYEDAQIQIVDLPSFPNHDKSIVNSADTLLFVIESLDQIKEAEQYLQRTSSKIILIFNKIDLLDDLARRKLEATLNSKYKNWNYFLFSSEKCSLKELESLKKKIFESFPIIRVYTKEPRKEASKDPMILKKDSTLEIAAEKILKGLSKRVKRARVWGPSSKFGGQIIGLDHVLKDKDVIEFQTG